ncbi:sigma-70 family RNA polymerase sigma factor [uncultured Victivallis sp.]|uniref:RNA polymerase sigma factor n=1 Tax=uncultured Victivallis sp. TaxID=354118 RepID=UPI0025FE352E|nr:sigma-70 family RNA polymerase sigma factor [uncultured Victivallis sp.]
MPQPNTVQLNSIAASLLEYRERLLSLAKRNLNPILLRRVTPEDVVQDTLSSACQKIDFLENHPEVPVYFKLRTILFQTISALERKHLQSQKRDAYKELAVSDQNEATTAKLDWNMFADSVTGPLTRIARIDRYELLKKALESLPENDRQILELRHFDNMTNSDCAEVLHITAKNASIRYVRALERLQKQLLELTEFRS